MEMYLHLVNYSIKDFGPGKSALDKKQQVFWNSNSYKSRKCLYFSELWGWRCEMVSCCRSLQSFYFGYFDHALCCKPGASILAFIH